MALSDLLGPLDPPDRKDYKDPKETKVIKVIQGRKDPLGQMVQTERLDRKVRLDP